jgi:hypothetical protein
MKGLLLFYFVVPQNFKVYNGTVQEKLFLYFFISKKQKPNLCTVGQWKLSVEIYIRIMSGVICDCSLLKKIDSGV